MKRWEKLGARLRTSILAILALAQASPGRALDPDAPPPPSLEVELAGCGAVLEGPTCEPAEDGTVRLWVRAAEGARVEVALDGARASPESRPVQGGAQMRVHVPSGAAELTVTASQGDARSTVRLALQRRAGPSAVAQVDALRKAQRAAAEPLLAEQARDPDPEARAAALGGLARIHLGAGHTAQATSELEEAARLHRSAGRLSDALRDDFARAYALLHDLRRFADARRVLEGCEQLSAGFSEGRTRTLYYQGAMAYETGDLRSALRLLRASDQGAERLGLDAYRQGALSLEAYVLLALGREAEGEALLDEAQRLPPSADLPCSEPDLLTNLGWFAIRAADGRPEKLARARAALEEALPLYREGCPNASARANVLTDLALVDLAQGAPAAARQKLEEARREEPSPDAAVVAYWLDLEGRLALHERAGETALAAYDRLSELATVALLPEAAFRAQVGRGEALEAAGRDADAARAYGAAEALLDDHARLVPADEGRASYLGSFEESARAGVDLLLRSDAAAAATMARKARARALAALQWTERLGTLSAAERTRWEAALSAYRLARDGAEASLGESWKLSGAELRRAVQAHEQERADLRAKLEEAIASLGPREAASAYARPAEGELLLAYFPTRSGWAGFAIEANGTTGRALEGVSPPADHEGASPRADAEALSRALLAPFADAIQRAHTLRILAHGELGAVDFHALPWNGAPLVAALPVTYGLDLPGSTPDPRDAAGHPRDDASPGSALLVANARGDLRGAGAEARAVAAALDGGGFRIERLDGAEATHHAVLEALDRVAPLLLHYAGHGAFGGREGWDSGFPLAAGGFLTMSDVLALRRAPPFVVLSGCETARSGDGRVEGVGLAQAFVVAGARAVVAATRPVDDAVAARIMSTFYAAPPRHPAEAAARLREAALAALREDPPGDWSSFRVLVP